MRAWGWAAREPDDGRANPSMNLSLFRSPFALLSLAAIGAAVALALAGRDVESERWLRLWSGAAALTSMVLAFAYVARKYMHKYGYSPEFRLKVPIAQLERAETRLGELRAQVLDKRISDLRELRAQVARVLREEGVHRILRVDVRPGPPEGPAFVLEVNKAFLFGRAAKWLHLHLYISVAFAAFVALHADSGLTADFGGALLGLSVLVVVTGAIGIALWAFGPSWLSRHERDLSIEESFVLHQGFRAKLRELSKQLAEEGALKDLLQDSGVSAGDTAVRTVAALRAYQAPSEDQRRLFEDACVLHGQMRRVEREFRALWRIRLAFMAWRAVHIPAAILLAAAVVVHLVTVVRY